MIEYNYLHCSGAPRAFPLGESAEVEKGNPVRSGSGPAAVILIPNWFGIKNLYLLNATFPTFREGKAGKGRESQKTSLDKASQKSLRGLRL